MTELERRCPQCRKVLVRHERERADDFARRKHCNRECSTKATNWIWHRSIRRKKKAHLP